jgi:hypothetical protein
MEAMNTNVFIVNFLMQPKWTSSIEALAKFEYKTNLKVMKKKNILFSFSLHT